MAFWLTGIVLTAFTLAVLLVPMYRRRETASTPTAVTITAILIGLPVCVVLVYRLVGDYPSATQARAAADRVATNPQGIPDVGEMVASLAARLKQDPDDLEGWLMLGRSYVSLERFVDAHAAYQHAYLMTGGQNLTAALGYAEAMALADRSTLSGEAGVLFETALKAAPQNPKALWYGGMSAAAKGEMDVAADRWRRLLDQDLPDPVRQVVQQQLASLGDPMAAMPAETAQAGSSLVIAVQITVAEHLRERIDQSAALFIVARDPDQAGPPIAVVRQLAGSLPATINITDANLMLPGRSLADLPRLRLIARVARGGDPIAQPGDIYGEILWDSANSSDAPIPIVIDSVIE
jgi:cytochrome c-type biogenesis protein CcmH